MKKNNFRIALLLLAVWVIVLSSCSLLKKNTEQKESQSVSQDTITIEGKLQTRENADYKIMFYNCENLFDTKNDSVKLDDEFTPSGKKHWTWSRYQHKINNIAKVIIAVGGYNPPDIVGLCEIENRYVLNGLTHYTPLKKVGYKIIHKESPDRRGIDVAMLYVPEHFKPIKVTFYRVDFPFAPNSRTRDVLYVKGIMGNTDTLHIFVNHWPSKWGGQKETEPKRIFVGKLVRSKVDSIFKTNKEANIILIGDLNDSPEDVSVQKGLGAKHNFKHIKDDEIYDLSYYLMLKGEGSHKYHGQWDIIDHIIISGTLINKKNKIYSNYTDAHIFKAPFLLEDDEKYTGKKPFRTYIGYKYNGGFSDHLPVYLNLYKK